MTLIKIVAQAQVQSKTLANLPIILKVGPEFQIPPVTDVGAQHALRIRVVGGHRAWSFANSRIYACRLIVRGIGSESHLVIEIIGGAADVEFAVLDIAPEIHSNLHIVVAVADRNHVGVGGDVLFKTLRVPVVRTKTQLAGVGEMDLRHAWGTDRDKRVVLQIAGTKFVQDCRAESVKKA